MVEPGAHRRVVNVVLPVWGVEHLRGIVRILLLGHTQVYADVRVAQSVVLESDLQLLLVDDPLEKSKTRKDNRIYLQL